MKLQIIPTHFKELLSRGYNLDQIYLLKLIEEGTDIKLMVEDSPKIQALIQSLTRKGLVFEENKLTTGGKDLLIFVDSKDGKRIPKVKTEPTIFDAWWDVYPATDTFEWRGRKFTGSRSLRVKKDDCRTKFNKILLEGERTAEQLIEALKLEILQKKEKSFKEGSNKLSYMQNSFTYLHQRTYEGFIDLIKTGVKVEENKVTGATDI